MRGNYNATIRACFGGYMVQAVINTFVPLLFLTLRREYGLPILPADAPAQASLLLQSGTEPEDANPCPALTLFGPEPDLAGLRLSAPDLAPTDREDLPLLSALWEGGRLGPEQLKIT